MDVRLLDIVSCPGCRGDVKYRGASANRRLTTGVFRCVAGGLEFPIDDGIPVLAWPDKEMGGADLAKRKAVWEREDLVDRGPDSISFVAPTRLSYKGPSITPSIVACLVSASRRHAPALFGAGQLINGVEHR